jgi:hypothetical protein
MNVAQREMAKDESNAVAEMLQHELDDRMRRAAVRTFVVAVFDQRHRGIRWTENMVTRRDWRFER